MDALLAKLAAPLFPLLWLWHGLGVAAVLAAGRQPLWLAVPYGLVSGVTTLSLTLADKDKMGSAPILMLLAATAGCGLHLYIRLTRALHGEPRGIWLTRGAMACVFPFVGPFLALGMTAIVLFIRRRDHLDLLD